MTPRPTAEEIRGIYAGIGSLGLDVDVQGWNSNGPIFADLIKRIRPQTIVEVGSWKGASAIHMATIASGLDLDTLVYAVDCWLPPIGVWLGEVPRTHIPAHWKLPGLYEQFLSNVWRMGMDHRIIPVRALTNCGAWLLQAWQIQADLIYIDALHAPEAAVFADLESYWPLLRRGGVMFGDDYSTHPDVKKAVDSFSLKVGRKVREVPAQEGTQWVLERK